MKKAFAWKGFALILCSILISGTGYAQQYERDNQKVIPQANKPQPPQQQGKFVLDKKTTQHIFDMKNAYFNAGEDSQKHEAAASQIYAFIAETLRLPNIAEVRARLESLIKVFPFGEKNSGKNQDFLSKVLKPIRKQLDGFIGIDIPNRTQRTVALFGQGTELNARLTKIQTTYKNMDASGKAGELLKVVSRCEKQSSKQK